MLAFILPPLLVVCALAVLSYLFFQKLPEVERRERERSGEPSAPFLSLGDRLKHLLLTAVERLARWFKLLSLKVHNRLTTLATSAREARLRAVERIAEQKKLRVAKKESIVHAHPPSPSSDIERASRLQQWFGKKSDSDPSSSSSSFERTSSRRGVSDVPVEDEALPPLVSEPLQPMPSERIEREVRKRAADIGRKFGDAVRCLRPEKKPPIFPAQSREEAPLQKNQLEDILVERISMNPRDIEAYERLGDYYLEQKNLVDAKECYRQVLKLSPAYRLVKIKIRRLERLLEKERTP